MKNKISLMLLMVGCLVANNSCSEANLPAYDIQSKPLIFG